MTHGARHCRAESRNGHARHDVAIEYISGRGITQRLGRQQSFRQPVMVCPADAVARYEGGRHYDAMRFFAGANVTYRRVER